MVNFAQSFLANLANPAMSKSLFEAGTAIGSIPGQLKQKQLEEDRKKAFASATPLERYNLAIAQAVKGNDLAAAAKLTAARDKYASEQQVRGDTLLTDIVAAQMLAGGLSEVPTEITHKNEKVEVPPRLSKDVLEELNKLQTAKDARELATQSQVLHENYDTYIKNNPQLLEQNPMLAKTYAKIIDPDSKMLRTERANGIKALIGMVDADRSSRKEAKFGDAAIKVRVQQLVDRIEARGSKTWFWQGNDMADALGDMSDSEKNTFLDQATLYIKQNPKATDQDIIDYGMSGMKKKIKGQEQSEAITQNEEELATTRESNIQGVMKELGVSREEAVAIIRQIQLEATRSNRMNNFR